MSLILKLLGFTGLPPWVLELIVVLGLSGAIWGYHLHVVHVSVERGIQEQQAADAQAAEVLKKRVQAETDAKLKTAKEAADGYQKEISDLRTFIAHNPVGVPVGAPHGCGGGVPPGGPANHGTTAAGSRAPHLQPVPAGDSVKSAQSDLLGLLAERADALAAQLREEQRRRSP